MFVILHDNDSTGVLSAVYYALSKRLKPGSIRCEEGLERNLFDEYFYLKTNDQSAARLCENVKKHISKTASELIQIAALSSIPDVAMAIFEYLIYAYRYGSVSDHAYGDDSVLRIWQIHKNVYNEYHKYRGFLRFIKLREETYYAQAEPKNDIILLLADHFSDRMKNEKWVIHDKKRMTAAVYRPCEFAIIPFRGNDIETVLLKDDSFSKMWQEFLSALTIKERMNVSLQKNNMPLCYRKYMNEFYRSGSSS